MSKDSPAAVIVDVEGEPTTVRKNIGPASMLMVADDTTHALLGGILEQLKEINHKLGLIADD